jgi:hypothetical protein|tara:strand:- start:317 stop:568 length:252 start_codon:yes stop_codon:yes gene_type:complete
MVDDMVMDIDASTHPHNLQQNIKEIREIRERISTGLQTRTVEKEHNILHKVEKVLEQQRLAQLYSYDKVIRNKSEGAVVDIEV